MLSLLRHRSLQEEKENDLHLASLSCSSLPPFEPWRPPRTRFLPCQNAPSAIGLDRRHQNTHLVFIHYTTQTIYTARRHLRPPRLGDSPPTLHHTNSLHRPSSPQSSTSWRRSANSSITSLFKATNPTVGTILITAPNNGGLTSAVPDLFLFPGDGAATLTLFAATTAWAPSSPGSPQPPPPPLLPPSPWPLSLTKSQPIIVKATMVIARITTKSKRSPSRANKRYRKQSKKPKNLLSCPAAMASIALFLMISAMLLLSQLNCFNTHFGLPKSVTDAPVTHYANGSYLDLMGTTKVAVDRASLAKLQAHATSGGGPLKTTINLPSIPNGMKSVTGQAFHN
jgi:hypothetical protein